MSRCRARDADTDTWTASDESVAARRLRKGLADLAERVDESVVVRVDVPPDAGRPVFVALEDRPEPAAARVLHERTLVADRNDALPPVRWRSALVLVEGEQWPRWIDACRIAGSEPDEGALAEVAE